MIEISLMLGVFAFTFVIGYFLILKVPERLHSPLMSMTNAISGVTILAALLLFATELSITGKIFGALALILAAFNVLGGFAITDRMLRLFRSKRTGRSDVM